MAKNQAKRAELPDRRPALEGEIFYVPSGYMGRILVGRDAGGACEVHAKSVGGSPDNGQWICISCCVPLAHNWEKDSHCETTRRGKSHLVGNPPAGTPDAKHVLAWRSFDSGKVEVP